MPWLILVAAILGLLSAAAWVGWVSRIVSKSPLQAALLDGAIILPSLMVKQLWAYLENNPVVFAAYLLGSMCGTYLAVRWLRHQAPPV